MLVCLRHYCINTVYESPQHQQLYNIFVLRLDWTAARRKCRAWEGHLINTESDQEQGFIENIMRKYLTLDWRHTSSNKRLKSAVTQLFVQQFLQADSNDNILGPHYWRIAKRTNNKFVVEISIKIHIFSVQKCIWKCLPFWWHNSPIEIRCE